MKLRNKKTGEIVERVDITIREEGVVFNNDETYTSLAELNEEWEDYEEPKDYWCIDSFGKIEFHSTVLDEIDDTPNNAMIRKIIGNYFDTREEAGQAVEKLKAWKRLKDKGFEFKDFVRLNDCAIVIRAASDESWSEIYDDSDICFGGEK